MENRVKRLVWTSFNRSLLFALAVPDNLHKAKTLHMLFQRRLETSERLEMFPFAIA